MLRGILLTRYSWRSRALRMLSMSFDLYVATVVSNDRRNSLSDSTLKVQPYDRTNDLQSSQTSKIWELESQRRTY